MNLQLSGLVWPSTEPTFNQARKKMANVRSVREPEPLSRGNEAAVVASCVNAEIGKSFIGHPFAESVMKSSCYSWEA
jgi:hypothetical protein